MSLVFTTSYGNYSGLSCAFTVKLQGRLAHLKEAWIQARPTTRSAKDNDTKQLNTIHTSESLFKKEAVRPGKNIVRCIS